MASTGEQEISFRWSALSTVSCIRLDSVIELIQWFIRARLCFGSTAWIYRGKMSSSYDDGNHRWYVSGLTEQSKSPLVLASKSLRDSVYIEKCKGGVVQITGKVNAITINNVQGLGLIFDDAISIVEVINSKKVQVQVNGTVPTVVVDKSETVTIFASEASKESIQVVTSHSSAVNYTIPVGDDVKEFAVPERISASYKGGKFTAVIEESHGIG